MPVTKEDILEIVGRRIEKTFETLPPKYIFGEELKKVYAFTSDTINEKILAIMDEVLDRATLIEEELKNGTVLTVYDAIGLYVSGYTIAWIEVILKSVALDMWNDLPEEAKEKFKENI